MITWLRPIEGKGKDTGKDDDLIKVNRRKEKITGKDGHIIEVNRSRKRDFGKESRRCIVTFVKYCYT